MPSSATHSKGAVQVVVVVEIALPGRAAEALQVRPEPKRCQPVSLPVHKSLAAAPPTAWGRTALLGTAQARARPPTPASQLSPAPQETMVVGKVHQGVVIRLVAGQPIAHCKSLPDTEEGCA